MLQSIKKVYIFILALLPISTRFRAVLYKLIPRYTIGKNVRIGFLSSIYGDEISIGDNTTVENMVYITKVSNICLGDNVKLRSFTRISNIDDISISNFAVVGKANVISGPSKIIRPLASQFKLGIGSILTSRHFIDMCDSVIIGDNVTLAGRNSQVWTHYFDLNHNRIQSPVVIGNNVYVGSMSIITAGVNIYENVIISAGSCVTHDILESGVWTSHGELRRIGNVHDLSTRYEKISEYDGKYFLHK